MYSCYTTHIFYIMHTRAHCHQYYCVQYLILNSLHCTFCTLYSRWWTTRISWMLSDVLCWFDIACLHLYSWPDTRILTFSHLFIYRASYCKTFACHIWVLTSDVICDIISAVNDIKLHSLPYSTCRTTLLTCCFFCHLPTAQRCAALPPQYRGCWDTCRLVLVLATPFYTGSRLPVALRCATRSVHRYRFRTTGRWQRTPGNSCRWIVELVGYI